MNVEDFILPNLNGKSWNDETLKLIQIMYPTSEIITTTGIRIDNCVRGRIWIYLEPDKTTIKCIKYEF